MPELEAVIAEVKEVKTGTSVRGDWTLWHIIDGNQVKFSTFNAAHHEAASNGIGKRFKLTYEENEKGKNLKEIAGPLGADDPPALGTGDYIRGQTAPNDKKSITASVALKAAVDTLSHTLGSDSRAKEASERVLPLAESFYGWLCGKAGIETGPEIGPDSDIIF